MTGFQEGPERFKRTVPRGGVPETPCFNDLAKSGIRKPPIAFHSFPNVGVPPRTFPGRGRMSGYKAKAVIPFNRLGSPEMTHSGHWVAKFAAMRRTAINPRCASLCSLVRGGSI